MTQQNVIMKLIIKYIQIMYKKINLTNDLL
jgi:hypothetical protein